MRDHRVLKLGGLKQRALLALLLLHANEVVSVDRLIDQLWGESPPETAGTILQVYISRLRKVLEPERPAGASHQLLVTRPPGYMIRVSPEKLDLLRFQSMCEEARRAWDDDLPGKAAARLREALSIWRGSALADFAFEPFAQAHIDRLAEARMRALEDRIECELALGRHADLVGEIEDLVRAHPLRERLRGHLMVSLYRSGRQTEALHAYQTAREALVEELGIDPTPELQALEKAILEHDPSLQPPHGRQGRKGERPFRSLSNAAELSSEIVRSQELSLTDEETDFPPVEERKVVSVLFVDLVEFTARFHEADPEDLRDALRPYHRTVRTEVERFGGTIEKFIGDAVMAIFGAPLAHEDDAERAVRAALRMTEAIEELNDATPNLDLAIRTAVNTGEGLVTVTAKVQTGEGIVTGDVVNMASRLQELAPVNGVVVGELTYRFTKEFIVYDELEPVLVKGKPEPIRLWRAVSARSQFGIDVDIAPKTPFIGRTFDLAALESAYQRTLREDSVQLVTIAGEPGVGKTRLLFEFSSFIDEQEDLVCWRQGRSLPYGEGITFWALGEIVKAQAGILESDSPEQAGEKLAPAVAAVVEDESEQSWIRARLSPLVGLGAVNPSAPTSREESFTAWRRFLEAIAERSPLVLVFEDLHWADQALLEFIDHLVEWSSGVALMIVCTARPELYESAPAWGGGKRNSTTISLPPLTDSETSELISGLLSQAVLPAEVHAALLERAGGNPLYAEEFVRILSDRGLLQREGRVMLHIDQQARIPMPETVQALIAARLDTLAPNRKALLHDAAVAGKVFWSGAVALLGGQDDEEVRRGLHELARKELVRLARSSSMEGEQEYSFWHALVRDVAYSQIPRAVRGAKHKAMGSWLESIAGERVSDFAELLVHHYTHALDLANAAGEEAAAKELAEPACRFLLMAGDRAFELDMVNAESYYSRALDLSLPGERQHLDALAGLGRTARQMGRVDDAEAHFEQVLVESRRCEERRAEAGAVSILSMLAWSRGDGARSTALGLQAVELLERMAPGPDLARAYVRAAKVSALGGRASEALEWCEKALEISARIGDQTQAVTALTVRGGARCDLGDLGGTADLRRAVREGRKLGLGTATAEAYSWLAEASWLIEGADQGAMAYEETRAFADRRGFVSLAMHTNAEVLRVLFDLGMWDQIVGIADDLLSWSEAHHESQVEANALLGQAHILVYRGNYRDAAALQNRLLELGRQIEDLQVLVPSLAVSALIEQPQGHFSDAVDLIGELDRASRDHIPYRARHLPTAVRVLVWAGEVARAEAFIRGMEVAALRDRICLLTGWAVVAEANQDHEQAIELYDDAAQRWADFGFVLEHGQALLGAARCTLATGQRADVPARLHRAREIFTGLGARPLIDEVDAHLHSAAALSS